MPFTIRVADKWGHLLNVDESKKLKKVLGLWGLVSIGLIGAYPIGVAMSAGAGFVVYAGVAAPLVLVFGALMILFFTVPIFEYSRITAFNGGYYGLAELGLGRAVGKYTATINLLYLLWWNIVGPAAVSFDVFTFMYYLFHYQIPAVLYIGISAIAMLSIFVFTVYEVKTTVKAFMIAVAIEILTIASVAIYVIAKAPYNSVAPFLVSSAPAGLNSIMLGVIVAGFLSYVMYGNPLFFAEEGKSSYKDSWRAMVLIIVIFTLLGLLGTYSEIATVNPSSPGNLTSVWNPAAVFYLPYIGFAGVFIYLAIAIGLQFFSTLTPGMTTARMFFSMARDGFFKSKWLGKIDPKRGTPINGAIANLAIGMPLLIVFESVLFVVYGSFNASFYALFLSGSMGVAFWFFHHIIPDISFPVFLRKNKVKLLSPRYFFSAIVAPAGAIVLFVSALYYGYSGLAEPYFAGFVIVLVMVAAGAIYTAYKWHKGELGESYVKNTISTDFLRVASGEVSQEVPAVEAKGDTGE